MPLSQSNYTRTKRYAGLATIAYVAAGTYMITRYIADLDFLFATHSNAPGIRVTNANLLLGIYSTTQSAGNF